MAGEEERTLAEPYLWMDDADDKDGPGSGPEKLGQ